MSQKELSAFINQHKDNPELADFVLDAEESLQLLEQSKKKREDHDIAMTQIHQNNKELGELVEELKSLCKAKGVEV